MTIRSLFALLPMLVLLGCAAEQQRPVVPPIKIERHQWDAGHGQTRYRDDYYRGGQRILRVVR